LLVKYVRFRFDASSFPSLSSCSLSHRKLTFCFASLHFKLPAPPPSPPPPPPPSNRSPLLPPHPPLSLHFLLLLQINPTNLPPSPPFTPPTFLPNSPSTPPRILQRTQKIQQRLARGTACCRCLFPFFFIVRRRGGSGSGRRVVETSGMGGWGEGGEC